MDTGQAPHITLIAVGTIGLSFAALHLTHLPSPSHLTIYDTRPDLESYVYENLPKFYTAAQTPPDLSKLHITNNLQTAVRSASIIQESGPENLEIKQNLWRDVEAHAPKHALLWSSTSGIPASKQSALMADKSRLLVVHPYNPPHIMPLLELVPSPQTSPSVIERTQEFWTQRGRVPIHIKKEITGFVSNRLAFALLREAIHLVDCGVVSVAELDAIVESSMGPRWAVAGPFKSYHAGGGAGGLEGFFKNVGGTVQACWEDGGNVNVGDGSGWEERVFREAKEAYGFVDTKQRDDATRRVLEAVSEEKGKRKEPR
ncbi:hypothetical protein K491DRAFT_715709 [Lophiostoma macrostomum CBS 122681]|uniref:NAD(P)-binding protein n=1 Tax=Lophiostoma macrostomum CBS 122681 TaxID=1314788 RepID=A0A6A6T891_9PLEO|nr:hypothetical protein K491DRAFT_715709 [Lophiostoma macrostomum CBS 122681]